MKFLFVLILYLSLVKATFFLPSVPDVLYYGCFLLTFLWLLVRGKKLFFSMTYLPFLLAIFFSIVMNDIPAVYKVPFRLAGFCSIAFLIGPFWHNTLLTVFRKRLFVASLWTLQWITMLSFFCKMIGLPFVNVGEDFRGLSNYSMLMGPLAGVSLSYCLYLLYAAETKQQQYIGLLKVLISFFVIVLSGSRSALGASLLGVFFFMGKIYHFRLFRLVQAGVIMGILALSTMNFWLPMTERMQKKIENGEKEGSFTASRDGLWTDRVNEFVHYPFFGVGFASYNQDIVQIKGSDKGRIEPGNSWLFLLSSMGLMGFFSLLLPVGSMLFSFLFKQGDDLRSAFLGSLLVLLMSHMIFEGYVVASGAYLCFFLWLVLGECYTCLVKNK